MLDPYSWMNCSIPVNNIIMFYDIVVCVILPLFIIDKNNRISCMYYNMWTGPKFVRHFRFNWRIEIMSMIFYVLCKK